MEVVITAKAEFRLEEIHEYYSEEASPEKATEIVNQIIDRALSLDKLANRGRIDEDLRPFGKDHRYILERHYRIIYRVEGETVYVTDIFSNWQHPDRKVKRNR